MTRILASGLFAFGGLLLFVWFGPEAPNPHRPRRPLQAIEQVAGRDFQSAGDLHQRVDADDPQAALKLADLGAVH